MGGPQARDRSVESHVFRRIVAAIQCPELNAVKGGGSGDQRIAKLQAMAHCVTFGACRFLITVSFDMGPRASSQKCNISVMGNEHRTAMLGGLFNQQFQWNIDTRTGGVKNAN